MAYIVRIDKPKGSPKGTHGWQVRIPSGRSRKYKSRLFSDGVYGGSPESFSAAREYLADQPRVNCPANKPYHKGRLLGNNTSGVNGVYRTSYVDKGCQREYWGVFVPVGPEGQKWHKDFSIIEYGEQEAFELAVEFRREWEKAVEQGKEALELFFDEYHYKSLNLDSN